MRNDFKIMPRIVFNNHDWTSWWSQWGEKDGCFQFLSLSFPFSRSRILLFLHPLFFFIFFFFFVLIKRTNICLHCFTIQEIEYLAHPLSLHSVNTYIWMNGRRKGWNEWIRFRLVWFLHEMTWRALYGDVNGLNEDDGIYITNYCKRLT